MEEHHAYLTLMMDLARDGADDFDLVLNNSLHHLPVAMAPSLRIPVVTTLHTPPVPWLESAIEVAGGAGTFVAVSRAMSARVVATRVSAMTILNGVDPRPLGPGPGGEDAVWSGRLVPEKAPHEAIDAVRRTGRAITAGGADAGPRRTSTARSSRDSATSVRYAGHLDQRAAVRPGGIVRGCRRHARSGTSPTGWWPPKPWPAARPSRPTAAAVSTRS